MTATTLKLSDLAGPDADGWSDVAVFVRADGRASVGGRGSVGS